MEAIYHAEGRITPLSGSNYQYEYTIKDHLGNARLSFADLNANSIVDVPGDILQENHYYPFGMNMNYGWMNAAALDNRYQYNGKELNDDFGLNWYAYGTRYYDPVIGRFAGIDPIADKFVWVTVYNYAENEPVANIDLHGLQKLKASDIGNAIIGNDQKGIITTANPQRRDEAPFLAAIQDFSHFALSGLGINTIDNIIADVFDSEQSTGQKVGSVIDEVFEGMAPIPGNIKMPKGGVYILKERESIGGAVRRTGQTSDLNRRKNDHANAKETKDLELETVHRTDNYDERRGLEHKLYEEHKSTANKENGGLNKEKAISDKNPNRSKYINAADEFLKNSKKQ